jgi:hypothetical protein
VISTLLPRKGWQLPYYSGDIYLNPNIITKPNSFDLARKPGVKSAHKGRSGFDLPHCRT